MEQVSRFEAAGPGVTLVPEDWHVRREDDTDRPSRKLGTGSAIGQARSPGRRVT